MIYDNGYAYLCINVHTQTKQSQIVTLKLKGENRTGAETGEA